MGMKKEIEVRITGRVQLVMFRDFVQRKSRTLFISGFVHNEDDGSVYIVAQGTEENLKKLIEHLHKGSFLSRVDGVSVVWREPTEAFSGFTIAY
ncbi:MAG: acylphosphatase [Parcubacteria group bacterium]|nr:acylphosphatase [Parcubacteria group bacterium]